MEKLTEVRSELPDKPGKSKPKHKAFRIKSEFYYKLDAEQRAAIKRMERCYLLHHEYLLLTCNASDKIALIKQVSPTGVNKPV